jgi:hypothetical protein
MDLHNMNPRATKDIGVAFAGQARRDKLTGGIALHQAFPDDLTAPFSLMSGFWDFLEKYGNVCSVMIGTFMLVKLITWVAGVVMRCLTTEKRDPIPVHLLQVLVPSFGDFMANRRRRQASRSSPIIKKKEVSQKASREVLWTRADSRDVEVGVKTLNLDSLQQQPHLSPHIVWRPPNSAKDYKTGRKGAGPSSMDRISGKRSSLADSGLQEMNDKHEKNMAMAEQEVDMELLSRQRLADKLQYENVRQTAEMETMMKLQRANAHQMQKINSGIKKALGPPKGRTPRKNPEGTGSSDPPTAPSTALDSAGSGSEGPSTRPDPPGGAQRQMRNMI